MYIYIYMNPRECVCVARKIWYTTSKCIMKPDCTLIYRLVVKKKKKRTDEQRKFERLSLYDSIRMRERERVYTSRKVLPSSSSSAHVYLPSTLLYTRNILSERVTGRKERQHAMGIRDNRGHIVEFRFRAKDRFFFFFSEEIYYTDPIVHVCVYLLYVDVRRQGYYISIVVVREFYTLRPSSLFSPWIRFI